MKIKEFIEKVNDHDGMRAKKVGKEIVIGAPNDMVMIHILEDATNLFEIDTWETGAGLYQYWTKSDREYLSALIEEFIHTPIKERFPEKKYRLVANPNALNNYGTEVPKYIRGINSGYDHFTFLYGTPTTFSEGELEHLKKTYPNIAPAIDVMKEPVEEE